jgi:mannose-1-phosphate guanylyltransferase
MGKVYAVVMAGGVGTRFWPRSREKSPKQLLEIVGKGTMIQNTVGRLDPLIGPRDTFVITNRVQRSLVIKQLPGVPPDQILDEPVGRNTAPCIALAALHLQRLDPDAVMVVVPADHTIQKVEEFHRILGVAITIAAESGSLLTIGLHPTRPETGYGYIQGDTEPGPGNPYHDRGALRVKAFAEKPNLQTAERFLQSGDFLWNSGMFVWRVDAILREIKKSLPDLYAELSRVESVIGTPQYQSTLETVYGIIRGISIDYGVMEKSDDVFVIPAELAWNDLGSWDEVLRISGKDSNGNSITGTVIQKDTKNCYVYSPDSVVATIGVEDMIIVNTSNALLVCRVGQSQEVKEVADYLRRKQMFDYL